MKIKNKSLMHEIDCRAVLTSDQAFDCPLCRVRATGPDLLSALKASESLLVSRGGRWSFEEQVTHNKIKAAIKTADGHD